MKHLLFLAALSLHAFAYANGCDCQGTTGGLGASHGHFGGSNAAAAAHYGQSAHAGASQSGNGGSYWTPAPDSSLVDGYQPWPESEVRQFQKP